VKGGPSPNPRGRPRSGNALAEAIRLHVEPRALIAVAARIIEDEKAPASVKLQAAQFLAERGFVRPEQRHELVVGASDPDDEDLSACTLDELHELEQLERRRTQILEAAADRMALPAGET
jgi:hypothetical protein